MRTAFGMSVLLATALSAAPAKETFTGVVTDDMCALDGHGRMQMGPTDAECTRACIRSHGATYVLSAGKNVYGLSDQQTPETGRPEGQSRRYAGCGNQDDPR